MIFANIWVMLPTLGNPVLNLLRSVHYFTYVQVRRPPADIVRRHRLDTSFYTKYTQAYGVPVLANHVVDDRFVYLIIFAYISSNSDRMFLLLKMLLLLPSKDFILNHKIFALIKISNKSTKESFLLIFKQS